MRSLELNWLRRHDRHIIVPEVIFTDLSNMGGYYLKPQSEPIQLNDREYDGRFGALVIANNKPDLMPGTIAHEWRHHWQWCHDIPSDHLPWAYDENICGGYENGIKRYFGSSRTEQDALLFEQRLAPNYSTDYWMDILLSNGSMNVGI